MVNNGAGTGAQAMRFWEYASLTTVGDFSGGKSLGS
jgi:hypothetical protein